jgi:hypothetical protein
VVRAGVSTDADNRNPITGRIYIRYYDERDTLERMGGPPIELMPGTAHDLEWRVPGTRGHPIAEIGLELGSEQRVDGRLYLDYLTWGGAPDVALGRPAGGTLWRRAWVDGMDHCESRPDEPYRLIQDYGTGLIIQGTREWDDYCVTAHVTPHMVRRCGIAARVQGMRRYYALLLHDRDTLRLVKELDGTRVLAEAPFPWQPDRGYELGLRVAGDRIEASVDGYILFDLRDTDRPLDGGGVALVCEEGRMAAGPVRVQPAGK